MTKSSRTANADGTVPRRAQVANACMNCRTHKVKCSGKHPTCSRCRSRGLDCEYDVSEEGVTKRQHLRQELSEQRDELDKATAVLDVLRHGSDEEATATLARLRLGQSLEHECAWIESRSRQHQQQLQQDPQCTTTPLSVQESPASPELLPQQSQAEEVQEELLFKNGQQLHATPMVSPTWPSPHAQLSFDQSMSAPGTGWDRPRAATDGEYMAWSQPVSPADVRMSTNVYGTLPLPDSQAAWTRRYQEAPQTSGGVNHENFLASYR